MAQRAGADVILLFSFT